MKPSAASANGREPRADSAWKRQAATKNSGCMSHHTPPARTASQVRCRSALTAVSMAAWVEAQAESTTKCGPSKPNWRAMRAALMLPR